MNTRLEKFYKENVVPALMKEFGYTNPMEVPKLVKVTLNMGVGEAATNKKILENAVADMSKISGQKPVVTKSRVSVASFKIRDGWPIGCKTTLRRAKMYGIPGSPDQHLVAARARLPWCVWSLLRRPWQFQYGCEGTDHLPGNRLRRRRRDSRYGYRHHHHRQDGCGSEGAAGSVQVPVP